MASLKQIAANRRNSQKSTGPRTEAGKAASSANALRSGIYSNLLIIRAENAGELENLTAEFFDLYQPTAPDERSLVDTLVVTEWLLRRMRRCEAQLWEREFVRIQRIGTDDEVALGAAFYNSESEFHTLQARLNSLDRTFHRALTDLARLQKSRQTPPDPPQPADPEPVSPKLASFPQKPLNPISEPTPAHREPPNPGPRPPAPDPRHGTSPIEVC